MGYRAKWGIGRKEKSASRVSGARSGGEKEGKAPCSIFLFIPYPTWEPVHKLQEGGMEV